jgi:tRNA:m4X modification enzyme
VHKPFQSLSHLELDDLVSKIECAYKKLEECHGKISLQQLDHSSLDVRRQAKEVLKHVDQQASLIGHLQNLNALSTANNFVEFGAGKGV